MRPPLRLLAALSLAVHPALAETPSPLARVLDWPPPSPVRVPCHPSVTTTVLFPETPGIPDGAGFTEDPGETPADFQLGWTPGDFHLSVVPLRPRANRNMNVPFTDGVVVLLFETVENRADACCLIRFEPPRTASADSLPGFLRSESPPPAPFAKVTAARIAGMLDRLRLIQATSPGPARETLLGLLRGTRWAIPNRSASCGPLWIEPSFCLRDDRLNLVGFSCVLTNRANVAARIDRSSFAARAGDHFHLQVAVDAPETLPSGGSAAAFFVIDPSETARLPPLSADNNWLISVKALEIEDAANTP